MPTWYDKTGADQQVAAPQPASKISDSTTAGRALLTASNVAAQLTALGVDLQKIDAVALYNTGSSTYPTRASITSDTSRRVRFVGPTAPAIGGTGAISGLDVWEKTA